MITEQQYLEFVEELMELTDFVEAQDVPAVISEHWPRISELCDAIFEYEATVYGEYDDLIGPVCEVLPVGVCNED